MQASIEKQCLILFDGVCVFCNRSVHFIIKRDPYKIFKFASLQSEFGKKILNDLALNEKSLDSLVLIKDNRHYLKSTAALKISQNLKWPWKLLYVFRIIPRPIRDFFYDLFAKNRYRLFGKKEVCMIPSPEIKERFLS